MQYKTIVLELLQQQTPLHDQLRRSHALLPMMEACAIELKARHQHWQKTLLWANPNSHSSQIASDALETALAEMNERLQSVSLTNLDDAFLLDRALALLRRPTSSE